MQAAAADRQDHGVSPWRITVSGLCACLVGIGLARFAYTPLIPALIEAGWFSPSDAVYLGAANLAGYLAGALLARPMAGRVGATTALRAMMLLATAAFFACATPISFAWYFLWRVASGLSGGALMALAAPVVLPHVPPSRHGLAGGAIFTGVGLGIAASGTIVPLLLRVGLMETWIGLGALSLLLTVIAWGGWQRTGRLGDGRSHREKPAKSLPLRALYLEYGLVAAGLVPHMVFLVDFVARGLGQGIDAGGWYWVLFGVGALLGPLVAGSVADRIGFGATLRLSFVVQALFVGLLVVADDAIALAVSSLVIGAFVPGVVPLVLGRVNELLPDDAGQRQAAWGLATTAFAAGQAAAAYGYSFLFDQTGSYAPLFAIGGAAMLAALVIDLAVIGLGQRQRR